MVDGVELLSQKLGVSLLREYRYVDDAIRKDDVMGVRLLMRMRNRSLIRDIHRVAERLGQMNRGIDDLLLTPGYRVEIVYNNIANGAAKGGHIGLVNRMLENGADSYNAMAFNAAEGGYLEIVEMFRPSLYNTLSIVYGAAKGGHRDLMTSTMTSYNAYISRQKVAEYAAMGGHRDIVMEMLQFSNDYSRIAELAIEHGYKDLVYELIRLGANDYDTIAIGAAKGGYAVEVMDMIRRGAEDYHRIAIAASIGGYTDIVIAMIDAGHINLDMLAYNAAKYGHRELLSELVRRGADRFVRIAYNAATGGYIDIVMEMLDMNDKEGYDLNTKDVVHIASIAAQHGHTDIILKMVKLVHMSNKEYNIILDSAEKYGYTDIAEDIKRLMSSTY